MIFGLSGIANSWCKLENNDMFIIRKKNNKKESYWKIYKKINCFQYVGNNGDLFDIRILIKSKEENEKYHIFPVLIDINGEYINENGNEVDSSGNLLNESI